MFICKGTLATTAKWLLTALCLAAALWAISAPEWPFALAQTDTGFGTNHALIIGISNYDEWPKLQSPAKDAEEVARILTERYNFKNENVVLLTDNSRQKPTRKTILTYLENYVANLKENDHLLVFFSGNSTEDDRGESYWIPKDGSERSKLTWLRHSDLCREFFASPQFKAKSLYIITDSLFSKKLFKSSFIRVSPRDLRYRETLNELASLRSRKVIALGEEHWEPLDYTEGFGLFMYYFRKALLDDWPEVIDFENMIFFDERNVVVPILKRTGSRMLRGRLEPSTDEGGESFIALAARPAVIDVADVRVSPKSVRIGDSFRVQVKTDSPAHEVYLELDGKKYLMQGQDTEWTREIPADKSGTRTFTVTALNPRGEPGRSKSGRVSAVLRSVKVIRAAVNPEKGLPGEKYEFRATTDLPAKSVTMVIAGKPYAMRGSGTQWSLTRELAEPGTIDFSMTAVNADGVEGPLEEGFVVVEAHPVNVAQVQISPEAVYRGEEFVITAQTDRSARGVSLEMDGVSYAMEGSGKRWQLRKAIGKIGKKEFSVIARNIEDRPGPARSGEVIIKPRPLPLAEVAAISVSPEKVFAGEPFVIKAQTTAEADKVYIETGGRRSQMGGAGTEWRHLTAVDQVGASRYTVVAVNADGKASPPREVKITIVKRPAEVVNVAEFEVTPDKGYLGEKFAFQATTDLPAKSVAMVIAGKRYAMEGSATHWSLTRELTERGAIAFSMLAANEDGVEGPLKGGVVVVEAQPVNVSQVQIAPEAIYSGEAFVITAQTDRPAQSVALEMDGLQYAMEGSDRQWRLRQAIGQTGKKEFAIVARNIDDKPGPARPGAVNVQRRPLPLTEVAAVSVSPKEIYAGKPFVIKARTAATAEKVFVEIEGRRYLMGGAGTEWSHLTAVDRIGTSRYAVVAVNADGKAGPAREGEITIVKRPAEVVNVAKLEVEPAKGYVGEKFAFQAATDLPAESVAMIIANKRYAMEGSGTQWRLTRELAAIGAIDFSMIATNEDGIESPLKGGVVIVEAHPVNVSQVQIAPQAIYSGEEFVITAQTDREAQAVSLQMDGTDYAMEGSGRQWQIRKTVGMTGKKEFAIVARNIEDRPGPARHGEIRIQRRPLPIPEVAEVSVSPQEVYAGEQFVIKAKTTAAADKVYVEIEGQRHLMGGAGTAWSHLTAVDRLGTSRYTVVAVNADGKAGPQREERITIVKRPAEVVNVAKLEVNPGRGYAGEKFVFKAATDRPAKQVDLIVSDKRYQMEGSGKNWGFSTEVEERGTIAFSVTATNEDGRLGGSKSGFFMVEAHPVKVVEVQVSPEAVYGGEEFVIRAQTDRPAQTVALQIDGLSYAMEGSGKQWQFKQTIGETGKKGFTLVAKNIEDRPGPVRPGEVIIRRRPLAIAEVAAVSISPEEVYAGKPFVIKAQTTVAAERVYVEIEGEQHLMDGAGTDWIYLATLDRVGTGRYKIVARNADGKAGAERDGRITVVKPPSALVNVANLAVTPAKGYAEEKFTFKATTDKPAQQVDLVVSGTRYAMEGSGKEWFLERNIEQRGTIAFSATAANEDGKTGGSMSGFLSVEAHPVKVVQMQIAPEAVYGGEEFVISAQTDRPAQAVDLQIDGVSYPMEGSGTQWQFRKRIGEIGKKEFTIVAKNIDARPGPAQLGEVLIQRRALQLAEVAEVSVSPKKVYAGEQFVIKARTTAAAEKVYVEINDRQYLMDGAGTQWSYLTTVDQEGTSRCKVVALNADGKGGPVKEMQLSIARRPAETVSVSKLEVNPGQGYAGEEFTFKATTDRPAKRVDLIVAGKTHRMKGDDKQWVLALRMREVGSKEFEVIAVNKDDVEGRAEKGLFVVEANPVKVVKVQITPKVVYAEENYVIQAETDRPAQAVALQMNGLTFEMEGSGKQWKFQRKESGIGKKKYNIIARNIEDKLGPPATGELTIQEKPSPIPAVAEVSVSPEKVYIGDQFTIKVKTNIPAHTVHVDINGKREAMDGAGTNWRYTTKIDKAARVNFKVSATNKDGRQSKSLADSVTIARRPAKLVTVAALDLKPTKGFTGENFSFKATTDSPARKVSLVVGENRYDMSGSGTSWTLTKKLAKPGDLKVSAMAFNEDGVEGAIQTALLTVEEKVIPPYICNEDGTVTDTKTGQVRSRFVDNGDGTVTDLCTDLMWLKQPKRIAVTWKEAREYCKQIKIKKYTGWRLPTLEELDKLIDKRYRNPALPPNNPFSEVYTHMPYWTKTDSRPPLYVYQVELSRGRKVNASKKRDAQVWPVRYAQ